MQKFISVIIPVYNGEKTIKKCLQAIFKSNYKNFEIIVVDDHSEDHSREIIKQFPCKLIELNQHCGAAQARNAGANASSGALLFFTDADCLLEPDTLINVEMSHSNTNRYTIIGGTYTTHPYDKNFYGKFQSMFVHYFETKYSAQPDYIATHAMAIRSEVFFANRGFNNDKYPILEDVEYSHRMREKGLKLKYDRKILVKHIFGFSIKDSLLNAMRKSKYWVMYSLNTNSILTDSGTASFELKLNVVLYFINFVYLALYLLTDNMIFIWPMLVNVVIVLFTNFGFFNTIHHHYGWFFCFHSIVYYIFVYPLAVGIGSATGTLKYIAEKFQSDRSATCSHP